MAVVRWAHPGRHPWLSLALVYAVVGIYWSLGAPSGAWQNRMFDFGMWPENDPGGWYIPAAHDVLLRRETTSFAGHPGTPLTLILAAEQAGLYAVAKLAGTALDLTSFVARNTFAVWLVAKLTMVWLSVLSCATVHRFSMVLTRRRDLAGAAAVLYATAFPTLYYLNRVSVEPLLVIFFLSTAVSLATARDAIEGFRAQLWAGAAGVCAVSAFFTKIHLMAAWPLFAAACLLTTKHGAGGTSLAGRLKLLGSFTAGAAVSAVFYSHFVNWEAFAAMWAPIANVAPARPLEFFASSAVEVAAVVLRTGRDTKLEYLLPLCTKSNAFFFFEFLFLVLSLVGVIGTLRRDRVGCPLAVWMLAYCAVVAGIWWYRARGADFHGFHYLMPVVGVLSPFAALAIHRLMPALFDSRRPALRRGLEVALVLAVVHYTGFFGVLDSKRKDHQSYVQIRADLFRAALRHAGPGERVAAIGGSPAAYHGLSDSLAPPGHRSILLAAVGETLISRDHPVGCVEFVTMARRQNAGVVLDFGLPDPGPRSLEEWAALPEQGRCAMPHEAERETR